jgi:cell shape-determining protein MreC
MNKSTQLAIVLLVVVILLLLFADGNGPITANTLKYDGSVINPAVFNPTK